MIDIVQALKEDYQRFPVEQTYSLYAEDVFFKDPVSQFRCLSRYRQMISLIETWFINPRIDLHSIERAGDKIETRWTLSWNTPLPWKPRIAISGRSDLQLNAEGLIAAHIDYWDCSRLDVLKQHFNFSAVSLPPDPVGLPCRLRQGRR